eukprot:TRINITY_DN2742_c0_g2_i1.p1 TRINITY_DN2742_c0_g2~~TRINITY_DN2742_c0_g2_i1.p1  ORF type:complete len:778 (-),score=181.70 TRINITY_DN2742_c0_g2_i1:122-2455(-)
MEEVEDEINVCIREYLEFNDFNATIAALESELAARGKPLTDSGSSVIAEAKSGLIKALEDGDYETFFDLWNQAIPAHTRKNEGQKIEFYINIYFAIFPVHPLVGGRGSWVGESIGTIKKPPLSRTMQIFQQYLSTKGAELSKTSAFLSFYALPYVPDPASHPSFQDIFTLEWVNEMKTRVNKFLDTSIKSSSKPRLYQIMGGNNSTEPTLSDRDLKYISELERTNQDYAQQQEKLQDDKNALLLITKELIQQLQRAMDGHNTTPEYLKQVYAKVGPFLPQQEGKDFSSKKIPIKVSPRARVEIQSSQMLASLNYPLLQRDLHSLPAVQKCTILQALRWRISQSEIGVARKMVLQAYIQHDLLGCSSPRPTLLNELLSEGSDPLVREYTARLINTISFECAGRAYLTQNLYTVQLLFKLLKNEPGDTITRQQAIGSLQKLSLRKSAQNCMNDLGIINWLLDVISNDIDTLSKYSLEYASALLLNLSLRPSGRKACEEVQEHDVLQVLNNLLEHENPQVRFYTNGTLYSVLSRPLLRERAKAMGMEDILKYLIQNSDENSAKQLEYILAQLQKEEEEDEEDDNSEDSNDDGDENDMVADEEEQPENINNQNLPKGEQLLCSKYLVSSDQANKEAQAVRQSVQGAFSDESYAFGSRNSLMSSTVPTSSHGLPSVFNSVTSLPPKSQQNTQKPNKAQPARQNRTPPRDRPTSKGNSLMNNESPPETPHISQGAYSSFVERDESMAFSSKQRVARTPLTNETVKLEPLKPAKVNKNAAKAKR